MTETKLYAWIFLSVREQPTPLWDILFSADGINRAEPSLEEMNRSFGWLQAQGLVRKEGKEYLYAETGITLIKSIPRGNIFSLWDNIAERFSQLPEIGFQPDGITEKEVAVAYRIRRKKFKEMMRKFDEN